MMSHIPVREVAERLSCSEETIRRLIRNKTLPALRLGNEYRIDEKDISASLNRNRPRRATTAR
jgi:excisionase family DNA binding protein